MAQQEPDDKRPLIAIIETDPELRELLDDFLTDEGFETVLCPDPSSAVSLARSKQPDLILLNLWLNQQPSGMRILTEFRRDDATAAVPVLLLSTDAGALNMLPPVYRHQQCQELTMPFDLEDLLAKITSGLSASPSEGR